MLTVETTTRENNTLYSGDASLTEKDVYGDTHNRHKRMPYCTRYSQEYILLMTAVGNGAYISDEDLIRRTH